jgi:hypothetical protein
MATSDEKNYGPGIASMMLGVCLGSYIEYGVTKEEMLELVASMYDGILQEIAEEHELRPSFGLLSDRALEVRIDRLKLLLAESDLPDRAKTVVLAMVTDELNFVREHM